MPGPCLIDRRLRRDQPRNGDVQPAPAGSATRASIAWPPSSSAHAFPLSRSSRLLRVLASTHFDRPQRLGILTCASEHIIRVGAGDHEAGTEFDQFALKRRVVANATERATLQPLLPSRVISGRPA